MTELLTEIWFAVMKDALYGYSKNTKILCEIVVITLSTQKKRVDTWRDMEIYVYFHRCTKEEFNYYFAPGNWLMSQFITSIETPPSCWCSKPRQWVVGQPQTLPLYSSSRPSSTGRVKGCYRVVVVRWYSPSYSSLSRSIGIGVWDAQVQGYFPCNQGSRWRWGGGQYVYQWYPWWRRRQCEEDGWEKRSWMSPMYVSGDWQHAMSFPWLVRTRWGLMEEQDPRPL